ncbi:nucleotide exchange factor GrpE [Haloechinothrix salitolerans]|uniref:nucleotide exchange factor GrpE n=1 Tax=Haloechinothrix salitolerans TaxID=926830 RepID=UPI003CD0B8AE
MATWFNRQDGDPPGTNPDDVPTGEIAAHLIAAADTGQRDMRRLRDDRAALIQLCLYALDRARSEGVIARIEEGLAGVGVTALRPDGQPFDPARHEAGGTVSTSDDSLAGRVAETEVVGFRDGDTLLRAPVVTVYTAGGTT